MDDLSISPEQREWRRESRSAWLRLAVLVILIANLSTSEHGQNVVLHSKAILAYGVITVLALSLVLARHAPTWLSVGLTVADALVVVALFHSHLFVAGSDGAGHALTTSNLAVAFVLLSHVALRLKAAWVVLYSTIVVAGWLALLLAKNVETHWIDRQALDLLFEDATLALAFGFGAFVVVLLIQDHGRMLHLAIRSERRRLSLSRFFSPGVVDELQRGAISTDLQRRPAAIMFVDLRSFTRFTESANPQELAELLADFRREVTSSVFSFGGTIDKFVGDGVMAVFGQPTPKKDDAERALRCAIHLGKALTAWGERRKELGRPWLEAGIGLHVGQVIGGIIQSGQHDEFTVIGDVVNVSARLEALAKVFDAWLVVSADLLMLAPAVEAPGEWVWKEDVQLEGRTAVLRVAYLPRTPRDTPRAGLAGH